MKMTPAAAFVVGMCTIALTTPCYGVQGETPSPISEEVTIPVGSTDVVLAGTMLLPASASAETPVAGVLLITGSGPQDRDESLMGQKPFKVLSEGLVERGYAVLRYDDRGTADLGIGQSTGSFAGSTTADFAIDAAAAVDHMALHPSVDASKIIVCGHSTGGLVTAMLLGEDKVPAGAVLLASPSVIGWELLSYQTNKILRETDKLQPTGLTPEQIDELEATQTALIQSMVEGDQAEQQEKARAAVEFNVRLAGGDPSDIEHEMMDGFADQVLAPMREEWMEFFLRYDPAEDLSSASVPVLAVFGGLDVQVVSEQNVLSMSAHLREAGHHHSTVMVLESQNHLFQQAQTGLMNEYATAGEPMRPLLIDIMVAWMDRVLAE